MLQFIQNVERMRVAQKHYFAKAAAARKTKERAAFAEASNALKTAKLLEAYVDAAIIKLSQEQKNLKYVMDSLKPGANEATQRREDC